MPLQNYVPKNLMSFASGKEALHADFTVYLKGFLKKNFAHTLHLCQHALVVGVNFLVFLREVYCCICVFLVVAGFIHSCSLLSLALLDV